MGLGSALSTAITGLNSNSNGLDVIGNNLANSNTTAFKASRNEFATNFFNTVAIGMAPGTPPAGTNPRQFGQGSNIRSIGVDFRPGAPNQTGIATDLFIAGSGFFVVDAGNAAGGVNPQFTRDGSFRLDAQNFLVTGNGFRVLGFGLGANPNEFQVQNDNRDINSLTNLEVPLGQLSVAVQTENVFMEGLFNATGTIATQATTQRGTLAMFDTSTTAALGAAVDTITKTAGSNILTTSALPAVLNVGDMVAFSDGERFVVQSFTGATITVNANAATTLVNTQAVAQRITQATLATSLQNVVTSDNRFLVTTSTGANAMALLGATESFDLVYTGRKGDPRTLATQRLTVHGNSATGAPDPPTPTTVGDLVNLISGSLGINTDNTTLNQPIAPGGGTGSNLTVADNTLIADGATFTVTDSAGNVVTFEFDPAVTTGGTAANVRVVIGATATDTATNINTAVNNVLDGVATTFGGGAPAAIRGTAIRGFSGTTVSPTSVTLSGLNGTLGTVNGRGLGITDFLEITGNFGTENDFRIDPTDFAIRATDGNAFVVPSGLSFLGDFDRTLDGNGAEILANGESAFTQFTVFDSLGRAITIQATAYLRSVDSTNGRTNWNLLLESPDQTVSGIVTNYSAIEAGENPTRSLTFDRDIPQIVSLTFDQNGQRIDNLTSGLPVTVIRQVDNAAAQPLEFTINFDSLAALSGRTNRLAVFNQDGAPTGILSDFAVSEDGVVNGAFDNGQVRPLGQVSLARFTNSNGLIQGANNIFVQGVNSGNPVIHTPGEAPVGTVQSGALELSNVDIAVQFVNLLNLSNAFNANSRTIATSQDLFTTLLQLPRT